MRATPAGADRFTGLDWWLGRRGAPLLADAVTTLESEIVAEHPAGDHWIVIGRVDDLRTSLTKDPPCGCAVGGLERSLTASGTDVYAGTVAEDVGPSEMRRQSAVRDT